MNAIGNKIYVMDVIFLVRSCGCTYSEGTSEKGRGGGWGKKRIVNVPSDGFATIICRKYGNPKG